MGRSLTYGDGAREVGLHIGFDVIESLEDLDFLTSAPVNVNGRNVRILTPSLPRGRLLAASWVEDLKPPCDRLTVIASNTGRSELLDIVRAVEVDQ
ncbi:MAG: hypothetical protein AABM30_13525 [Actinomycetota bacterium]